MSNTGEKPKTGNTLQLTERGRTVKKIAISTIGALAISIPVSVHGHVAERGAEVREAVVDAFKDDPSPVETREHVLDNGETLWEIADAVTDGDPRPVINQMEAGSPDLKDGAHAGDVVNVPIEPDSK